MSDKRNDSRGYEEYTVAVIYAINFEISTIRYILNREHSRLPTKLSDSNIYVLSELSGYNVILIYLPGN
ncbi:hypothetical protein QBC46DRAFT_342560 [Diplogelasinospora grovesii]|uniref:Uncharacterized protein n=1 Tax=Diplogelasinospora grovesii TaxID=303347 RepID=A0AAN6N6L8_9PEZI|nr:hypothetical protein QBC46DRAFT_342560 [Diplogelasinospora grovesii]